MGNPLMYGSSLHDMAVMPGQNEVNCPKTVLIESKGPMVDSLITVLLITP